MAYKTPLYRDEDNEFLGLLVKETTGWSAQTIFGYTIARTETEKEAKEVIFERGLTYLEGVWQYYDKDDHDWFPCVIKEANEHRVTVIRTNVLGYQDPDDFKIVILKEPTDQNLVKSS